MSDAAELYERNFYAWTQDQAARLRAWPAALRLNAPDFANLAEEIEDLGKSQRRPVRSLLRQVIQHLLKLRLHPDRHSERHWKKDINGFRDQLRDVFAENPSMRAARAELATDLWARAAELVRQDMDLDGWGSRAAMAPLTVPTTAFFDMDTELLVDDRFPPPPAG
ncbi:MAG: DUF29 domain-containing protein [Paracraurococcus sp.]